MCRDAPGVSQGHDEYDVVDKDGAQAGENNTAHRFAFEDIGMNAEGVDDDIERLQAHVFRRRIRVKPFFQLFDPLHTGRCSRGDFCRALANVFAPNTFNDAETPIDALALAEHFVDARSPQHEPRPVNYLKVCEVLDKVFTSPDLEQHPEKEVPEPGATVLDANGFTPRPVLDDSGVFRVLDKIANLTEQRAIDLHTCFNMRTRAPVDIRAGRMEPHNFVANFPLAMTTPTKPAALSKADMHLLVRRYTDDNGFVRLMPFERDVQDLVAEKKSARTWANGGSISVQNSGSISVQGEQSGISLQEGQGTEKAAARSSPFFPLQAPLHKQRPQTARTCRAMNFTRETPDPKLLPIHAFPMVADSAENADQSRCESAYSADNDLSYACKQMQTASRTQRPQSARSDRSAQVSSVGIALGASACPCPFARMPPGKLNPFAKSTQSSQSRPQSARNYSAVARQHPPPPTVMALLTRACLERRLRLYDIFKDADSLRKGQITRTQMCTALSVLGLSFSPQELDSLFASFASPDGLFMYIACAGAVEEVISTTKTPAGSVRGGSGAAAARAIKQWGSIQTSKVIDEDEKELIERVETAIANRLLSQRLDMFPIFDDLSRTRWAMPGHVTEGQFVRAMQNLDFAEVTPEVLNTLLEKYCDTEVGNEFNHIEFCKNIEKCQSKTSYINSRFDLADTQDIPKSKKETDPTWTNPYFDKVGNVRPCGSRPSSAASYSRPRPKSAGPFKFTSRPTSASCNSDVPGPGGRNIKRPQYGQDMIPAGWRPGSGTGNATSHWW